MEFSQFRIPQHHLPLWLPALRDFVLDFVPAQWHGSNFTLTICFLNNSACFVLVLIDFTPLVLNVNSFILSEKPRHLTSHYFCSVFHVSFVLLPIFSHPCLWSHWAKVLGTTKLTSLFCNFPPALPSLTCKTENNSQLLLKLTCLKIILLTFWFRSLTSPLSSTKLWVLGIEVKFDLIFVVFPSFCLISILSLL